MPDRRGQVLDAAVWVLGTSGSRQLTHRAVDQAAGVPAGSTSNYFRTREALLSGVVDHVAERERQAWEHLAGTVRPSTADQLAVALGRLVRHATGPGRVLTLARYAVFVEAAQQPHLQAKLAATEASIADWGETWLRAIGSSAPAQHTRHLLTYLDGMMLHQLAFPEKSFKPTPRLRDMLRRLVGG